MKKLTEGYIPQFIHNNVQGYEKGVSPELQALASEFARQMVNEYKDIKQGSYDLLKRYSEDEYFKTTYTPEYIEKLASGELLPDALENIRSKLFNEIDWHEIQAAVTQNLEKSSIVMKAIYDGAEEYLEAGLYASKALCLRKPFKRMEFTAIRNGFIEEWQPRGGIEAGMVDMLAQCYVAWQFWLRMSFSIAHNFDDVEEQKKNSKKPYEGGAWKPPSITAAEYLDRANQMADRFQRMFLRTLRQLRDLRRYSQPVIVNNAMLQRMAGNK